jgi:hypothetical protein
MAAGLERRRRTQPRARILQHIFGLPEAARHPVSRGETGYRFDG